MSAVDRILLAMHPLVIYRPEDVSAATGIDTDTCGKALRMLSKGGIIETINQGYRCKKVYQTKQRRLTI